MDPHKTQEAKNTARQLFATDPFQSLDAVARALDNLKRGLPKSTLSRIRTEMRSQTSNIRPPSDPIPPEILERIKPLVRRSVDMSPNVSNVTPLTHPPFEKPATPVSRPSSGDKYLWIQDWILDNLETASVGRARAAMLERFGTAISSTTINGFIRSAREAAGLAQRIRGRPSHHAPPEAVPEKTPEKVSLEQIKAQPVDTFEETLKDIIVSMQKIQLSYVEITPEKHVRVRSKNQTLEFKMS